MSTRSQERYDVYATFTTSFSQKEALRQAALDRGLSVSSVVRSALWAYLDRTGK